MPSRLGTANYRPSLRFASAESKVPPLTCTHGDVVVMQPLATILTFVLLEDTDRTTIVAETIIRNVAVDVLVYIQDVCWHAIPVVWVNTCLGGLDLHWLVVNLSLIDDSVELLGKKTWQTCKHAAERF